MDYLSELLNDPLIQFSNSLGKKPYFSNNLSRGLIIMSKKRLKHFKYVSLNQRMKTYIVTDIDRPGAALAGDIIGVQPSITVINPVNSHAHLMFKLNTPVSFTESSREKPKNYYNAVARTLNNRLGGDAFYCGLVTKNPCHPHWLVDYCNASYTLEELSEYCGTLDDSIQSSIDISFKEGRNCELFDQVRNWAYRHIKDYSSFIQWHSAILSRCENENQFNPPLPCSEIRSVAKSISKWTWD